MKNAAWILLFWSSAFSHAQQIVETVELEPLAHARSQLINLGAGDRLRIEALQKGELNPAIFIYRMEGGLTAKNDEDADVDSFEWTAPQAAQVEVLFYSRSDRPITYKVELLPPETKRGPQASEPKAAVVPVYFATSRHIESRSPFRVSNDTSPSNELSFGKLDVRVPVNHRIGQLELPLSIARFELEFDPSRHFVVVEPMEIAKADLYREVGQLASRSEEGDALVFIHGYNVSFDESALRAAQLACDLKFHGPVLFFSWPSQDQLFAYGKAQTSADRSAEPLSEFLRGLAEYSHVKRIHIIAHSMGNRVLAQALRRVDPLRSNIHQIALLAPDIDTVTFENLAHEFPKNIGPIAIYGSAKDKALQASAGLAGYQRLGQGGKEFKSFPGMECIDASTVDTSVLGLGHGYYASSLPILGDLYGFFQGIPPAKRFALMPSADGRYWIFRL